MSWGIFVKELFDWCVDILMDGAAFFGMSYMEINIWLFCIVEPIVFLFMLYIIMKQRSKIRELRTSRSFPATFI